MAKQKPLADKDGEVRELTDEDYERARPAREVLPEILGKEVVEQLSKPRGRPRSPDAKVSISLRIPPEVLARWKASGPGWQTRMVAALSRAAPRRPAGTGKDR